MKKIKTLSLAVLAALSLNSYSADLKVGAMGGQEADLVHTAAKVAKDRFGLDVEVVEFEDYVMPNIALAEGEIDANAFQHGPYLDAMVRDRNLDLVAVANTFIYPIGAYSQKINNIDELKDGAKIAFPNDPSNGARALILMHNQGLITLNDPTNLEASKLDVIENPRKFDLIDADAPSLPRILPDVDVAFINSNYAINADLLPKRDAILLEPEESPYMNIIAVRREDKDKKEILQFIDAYQSDEVAESAERVFKGAAIQGW